MPGDDTQVVYTSGGWELDLGRRELRSAGTPVPLGSRAFDILEVLVRAGGELVTKYDLMDRVWAGQIVEENTLQVHISAARKALGDDRDMLRTTSGRGYRLLGNWVDRPSAAPGSPPADVARVSRPGKAYLGNLPLGPLELIGRETSAQHLRSLMSAYRAVTLTGAGGIGKTKLALEVARSLQSEFESDAWLAELAAIADANLVSSTVAGTLDLELGGDEISAVSIARAIGDRKLLLVLDSCEHVIDAAAELAETILRLCPAVSILATSRESLRIDGEGTYPVPPLDVPAPDEENPEGVLAHSAVQLFIGRTKALRSDFSPQRSELPAIGAICRRLDGIPLAIELAAARAAMLGLASVLSRLDARFALLTGGRRTAVPRHKTLRATLDWSYELLPEAEQRLLRFLSIFPAGFTLDAATAVMGETADPTSLVVEGIANLITKSLVTLDRPDGANRWRLLETTRAYALEKLAESDETDVAARRHAEFLAGLIAPAASGPPLTKEGLARWGREIDNIRAALDWAFSPGGDRRIGCMLTAAYVPVWLHFELIAECRERTERALDSLGGNSDVDASVRMQLHIGLGIALTFTMGAVERTRRVLTAALELAEGIDDLDAQLRTLWCLCALYWDVGECRASHATAERFLGVARRIGDPAFVLIGERLIGTALHTGGRQNEAGARFSRVLDLYVAPKDRPHTIWFQFDQRVLAGAMLARVLCLQGLLDQAKSHAEASLRESRAAAHVASQLYTLFFAVFPVSLMTGDLATAGQAAAAMIDLATKHNATYWRNLGYCLEGKLLIARGEFRIGADRLRAALDTCDKTGWTVSYPEFLGVLAEARAALGDLSDALATVDKALAWAEHGGEHWYDAELLRIKGELLLRETEGRASAALPEDCFARAIDVAREQGSLLWELRAALSFARLRMRQERPAEARQLVAPVSGRFVEGGDTADLRAARAVLETLPS